MKLTDQVKKAVAALAPAEIKKLRDEQGVKDWDVVDLLPEKEAIEEITDGLEGDELEAVQAIFSSDPDRVADRLSAIQQRVMQSDDISDETRTAVLDRLSETAEKVGVDLPNVQADVDASASEGDSDPAPADPDEGGEEPDAEARESEDDAPSASALLDARDHLDEKVASVKESGDVPDEAIVLAREAIKPRVHEGELLTAEDISDAFDEALEGSKRAAESWKSKYETRFATGETGKDLARTKESIEEGALAEHI